MCRIRIWPSAHSCWYRLPRSHRNWRCRATGASPICSPASARSAITVPRLHEMKVKGEKIVVLTAYDASFAAQCDSAGVDVVLVGDSLGMVVQGHSSTLPVSVDDMVYHTAAAARG